MVLSRVSVVFVSVRAPEVGLFVFLELVVIEIGFRLIRFFSASKTHPTEVLLRHV